VNAALVQYTQPVSTGLETPIDVGFRPALVMFFAGGCTGDTENVGPARMCIGATDGIRQIGYGLAAISGLVNWSSRRIRTDRCVVVRYRTIGAGGTFIAEYEAQLASFTSNGLQLECMATDSGGRLIHALILGDCQGYVGTVGLGTTAPATIPVTGLGFQPAALIALHMYSLTVPEEAVVIQLSLGFMGERPRAFPLALQTIHCNDSSPTDTARAQRLTSSSVYGLWRTISPAGNLDSGSFLSYDPDGFTLNVIQAQPTERHMAYIAIGGCEAQELTQNALTSATTQLLQFPKVQLPRAILCMTTNQGAPPTAVVPNAIFGLGAAVRGGQQMARHFRSQDNQLGGTSAEDLHSGRMLRGIGVPSGLVEFEGRLGAADMSDRVVPIEWLSVSTPARQCRYLCLGDDRDGAHPQLLGGRLP